MPSSAVRANISPSRAAPSSMEYSVCTCRWTNESDEPPDMGRIAPFSTDGRVTEPTEGGPAAVLRGGEQSAYVTSGADGGTTLRQDIGRAPLAVSGAYAARAR